MADCLTGATILNNEGLANALVASGVPYVVGRLCLTDHDPQPPIRGDKSDVQLARDWYYQRGGNFPLRNYVESLDKRVIVQVANEQNHPNDGWFYTGLIQTAQADGRRVVIFNDSVGNPGDGHEVDGRFISDTWQRRIDVGVLRLCKQTQNYVGYHGYGKPEDYPGSAIGDDDAWKWYGGRILQAYKTTPADSQADILYTECGTFRASYQGIDFTLADMRGYNTRLQGTPVKCVMYWEAGGRGDRTFDRSCLDPALPAIAGLLRSF